MSFSFNEANMPSEKNRILFPSCNERYRDVVIYIYIINFISTDYDYFLILYWLVCRKSFGIPPKPTFYQPLRNTFLILVKILLSADGGLVRF